MTESDFKKLAAYFVQNYMKTSRFNEDLASVTSFTTEPTVINQR